jgi:uncharacterized protein involved in outer membrane biogenesis
MRTSSIMKLAAILLAAFTLLTVALTVAVRSINLEQIKEVLTAQVKAATGRALAISGPLEFRLGLTPRLVADSVALANPPGCTRPEMVKIKHLEMEVSLLPLLKHQILVNRLIVSSPDILIETEANGPGNLRFGTARKESGAKPVAATSAEPAFQLRLLEVKIENGLVVRLDRDTGKSEALEIQQLSVQADNKEGDSLAVALMVKARGHAMTLDGSVGRLAEVMSGRPWPVKLRAQCEGVAMTAVGVIASPAVSRGIDLLLTIKGQELGQALQLAGQAKSENPQAIGPYKVTARLGNPVAGSLNLTEVDAELGKPETLLLKAKGTVTDLTGTRAADMAVDLASPSLAELARVIGTALPPLGPMKLSGRLHGSGPAWKLSAIKSILGTSEINGELAVDLAKRPLLTGKLSADTLNLNDFTGQRTPSGAQTTSKPGSSAAGDGRIFSDRPLPVRALRDMDANLSLTVGKLTTGDLHLTGTAVELNLLDGRLLLKPFRAGLAGGRIEGLATLDVSGKAPTAVLNLTGRQVELGQLGKQQMIKGGKSDLKIELKGRGESLRALMASLTGETVLSVGEGKVRNKALNWASGDLLLQVLGSLNPLAKREETTNLTCAAVRFTIQDGLATANKGIAVRTDKVDVVGSGTVNLRTEGLDLGIRPSAREGVGLSLTGPLAGMTRIRGTITHPSVSIDPAGSLRTAASVGAAMATGGLSILGEKLVDKFEADSDPCRTALGRSLAKTKTQPRAKAKEQPQKSGSDNFLKGLFGR